MRVFALLAALALSAACVPSTESAPAATVEPQRATTASDALAPEASAVPAIAIDPDLAMTADEAMAAEDRAAEGLTEAVPDTGPALPDTPIGRATSTNDDTVAPGMVRVIGEVRTEREGVGGICVVLGPRPRCAVLTASDGKWVIDVPQGPIKWEVRFMRDRTEIALPMYVQGPFPGDRIAVPSLVLPY